MHFADRVWEAVGLKDSRIVVGLDPCPADIPPVLRPGKGSDDPKETARLFWDFNRLVIDAVADLAVAVKPQLAYYEVYGHDGIEALERTNRYAHQAGLLVICDGKRNDIGPTAEAYARAFLTRRPEDTWGIFCDALTVNPYLGTDGLIPFVRQAEANGKGLFVLAKTSNPSAAELQDRMLGDKPLYAAVAELVRHLSAGGIGKHGYGCVGAVAGATFPETGRILRDLLPASLLLVPGWGVQGGGAAGIADFFDR